jgi:hypothetical protein
MGEPCPAETVPAEAVALQVGLVSEGAFHAAVEVDLPWTVKVGEPTTSTVSLLPSAASLKQPGVALSAQRGMRTVTDALQL